MDLVGNPGLRAELEAARSWGVPWRRWAGWEPAEVTTYEYDDAGRLVRSMTVREAEWGELDRAAAMSLMDYEASVCHGCKQPLADATDIGNEERWTAEVTARCHSCTAAEILREKIEKQVEQKTVSQPAALQIRTLLHPSGGPGT